MFTVSSTNSNNDGYDFEFPVARGPYWKVLRPGYNYFTVLRISTSPAIQYVLLMDTGSSVTFIQCFPCDLCYNQIAPIFDPKQSLTYKVKYCADFEYKRSICTGGCNERGECAYSSHYGDGSYSRGVIAEEISRFGRKDDIVMNLTFGCAHNSNGSFNGSDGILGLGRGKLSFPSQIERKFGFKKFSYCLMDRSETEPSIYSTLRFGPDVLDPQNDVVYTPMIQNPKSPSHYFINLTGISVAGKLIPVHTSLPNGMLVDSGSILTWFPTIIYEDVRDSFHDAALRLGWNPLDMVSAPEVALHFDGDDKPVVKLRTQNVVVNLPGMNVYCLAFLPSKSEGLGVLGNQQQQGIRVVYDNLQSAIGFDPLSC
ncbi:hypothetical protein MKW94_026193 [Papaver nudicaule]|uniref:Peptidase A1 domain-containing protein n=1 Tax=Papaver nudicaule TaxID=74823 RepID=A0AA41SL56_PAPNU|nr:hypothetical protein [Papaver nudicaule]MCL7044744.1 hypothetical protein [Papaver nudicaule]